MRTILLYLSLLLSCTLSAQNTTVTGVVKGNNGKRLEGVSVLYRNQVFVTPSNGRFAIDVPAGTQTKIIFTRVGYLADSLIVNPQNTSTITHNVTLVITDNVLTEAEVVEKSQKKDGGMEIKARDLEFNTGPQQSVEGLIKTMPGVVSRNELSSQYSVRGGSFDENLVYVNGIEVYRPFLARSGQQEGLSFVNPDMVSNVYFSAGGFPARYGDKMSSVLDITYREPEPFGIRAQASFLGGAVTAEGRMLKDRLGMMVSGRFRTNQALLASTDLQAQYQPRFTDVQAYLTYDLSDEWNLEFLGNYARNNFRVEPQSSSTKFGTLNEALELNVAFDGQEQYFYTTKFGALKGSWTPKKNMLLEFTGSGYQTTEQELTDVIGYYRLGELNNNLGSDDFGEIKVLRGVGAFQNYLRNGLDAIVFNVGHAGLAVTKKGTIRWGARWQHNDIADRYKEWERIDSAGYSVPHTPSQIDSIWNNTPIKYTPAEGLALWSHYDTRASVVSNRIMTYLDYEKDWRKDSTVWRLVAGIRSHYWSFNNQMTVSPRAMMAYTPGKHQNMTYRFATGFYHQPPFYREFRDINGTLNSNIRAQEAIHFVLGYDYEFKMWNRPFKFATELYYKHMNNLIPYFVDNVRVRYSAKNNATGFATGVDFRLNGEFVENTESWASLSLFRVMEDIEGDGAGYIPRPTDTRFNFAIFFQDHVPNDPSFRVTLNLIVTGGFPFGAPGTERKEQVFRAPPYRRVDIGFIKVLKAEGEVKKKATWLNGIRSLWVGLEVFNLLQSQNTVSYLWVRDVSSAGQYAVPNYLTSRLVNLKLTIKI